MIAPTSVNSSLFIVHMMFFNWPSPFSKRKIVISQQELLFHLIQYSRVTDWYICLFLDSTVKKKQSVLCFYLSRWPEWRWFSCRFRPILNRLVLLQPFHRAYMEQCMDEKNCRDIKTKLTRDTSKYHCKLANNYPSPLSPSDEWFTTLAVVNSKKVWMLKTIEKKITRIT